MQNKFPSLPLVVGGQIKFLSIKNATNTVFPTGPKVRALVRIGHLAENGPKVVQIMLLGLVFYIYEHVFPFKADFS